MRKIVFLVLFAACSGALAFLLWRGINATQHPLPGTDTVTVTDLAGRQVMLPKPIKRIVLIRSFYVQELALILGDEIEEKLVGWDNSLHTGFRDAYLAYTARYPRLTDVSLLGDALRDEVRPEAVLALKPDLVIADVCMFERKEKFVEPMERAGLPLLFCASDDAFSDPQNSLLLLGKVLGKEERAKAVTAFIDNELDRVFSRLARIEGPQPSIYLEAGEAVREYGNTYGSKQGKSAGWGSILSRLRCRNIATDVVSYMGKINPEFLIKSDPDVIAMIGADWVDCPGSLRLGYQADLAQSKKQLTAFTTRPGWSELKAVKNRRVHGVHMRFGGHPTGFVAVQQLAKWLYPNEFQDLDPERAHRAFHDQFLSFPLSGTWTASLGAD